MAPAGIRTRGTSLAKPQRYLLRYSAKLASVLCCTLFKVANDVTVPIVLPAG